MHHRSTAAGLDESHFVVPANLLVDSDAAVEFYEISADAKQHMLAVVDNLPGARMLVGRGASAQIGTAFEQRDAKTGVSQGAGRGEAGKSASGDGHRGLCGTLGHQSDHALHEASTQEAQLLRDGEADFRTEDVVLALGNLFQQTAIDMYQHPKRGLTVFGDVRNQFLTSLVKLTGTVSFEGEQRTEARGVGRCDQFSS